MNPRFETGQFQLLPTLAGVQFLQEPLPSNFSGTAGPGLFGHLALTNIVRDPFGTPRDTDLVVEFSTPVRQVGAWLGNIQNFLSTNPSSITVSVYDAGHHVLSEVKVALNGTEGPHPLIGFESEEGIQRIEWRGANAGFFAVDDLLFSRPTTVPLPAALPLSVVALITTGIAATCRRPPVGFQVGPRRVS